MQILDLMSLNYAQVLWTFDFTVVTVSAIQIAILYSDRRAHWWIHLPLDWTYRNLISFGHLISYGSATVRHCTSLGKPLNNTVFNGTFTTMCESYFKIYNCSQWSLHTVMNGVCLIIVPLSSIQFMDFLFDVTCWHLLF